MSNGTTEVIDSRVGNVRPIDITDTMQEAYLDYAMSVIVSRALPDVRDGLKPVHRRILYAMYHDLGLTSAKPHKKSARIVGEVLGKYHPHGDTAVYDAMVRMAQDFSLRYPLVDGQGNFGSVDGDNAAAMRYTEARLAEISDLMLVDLEKDTVNWHANFDNSLLEPDIVPAALPNLLINGSSGIAVGMATNIPPHNLGEVVDALVYLIDHYKRLDDVTVEHLVQFVKGPDFPTGGIVYRFREEKGSEDLDVVTQGYSVGKARLVVQAKAHFEEMSRSRSRIVITELPYQTNKTALIERIASLVREGKIEGITDLRDESDRTGMRIMIELTRNVEPKNILSDLFKYTPLQQTFGMQMLALVDGQPRMLSLKRMLHLFIQHRQEIIRRRSEYELKRARERAHILEGLLKALDILDQVIATIRHSQTADTARTNLVKNFQFSEIQAQAILDMQLRRLAAMERKKLQEEYKDLLKRIAYLEDLLAHPEKILIVIKDELLAIKEKYGDARRTQIVDRTKGTLTTTDLLPDQDVWVSVAAGGDLMRQQMVRLGKTAARTVATNSQVDLIPANTRDFLYLLSQDGRSARIPIHEIPTEREKHLSELSEFTRRDSILTAVAVPRLEPDQANGFLFLATEQGAVKRVTLSDFLASAPTNPPVIAVEAKDKLIAAFLTAGGQDVILVSNTGQAIRFSEEDVRSMGLAAGGVGGMKLKKGERIIYAAAVDPEGELLTVTASGFAKRSPLADYPQQGRNGGGIVTHKPNSRTGNVAAARMLKRAELADAGLLLAVVSTKNKVSVCELHELPQMGRAVQGKQIMAIGLSDAAAAVYPLSQTIDGPPDEAGGGASPVAPSAKKISIGKPGDQTASPTEKPASPQTKQTEAPAASVASPKLVKRTEPAVQPTLGHDLLARPTELAQRATTSSAKSDPKPPSKPDQPAAAKSKSTPTAAKSEPKPPSKPDQPAAAKAAAAKPANDTRPAAKKDAKLQAVSSVTKSQKKRT